MSITRASWLTGFLIASFGGEAVGDDRPKLPRIQVTKDGKGFVAAGKPFKPWGHNYGNAGRLMEDFWEADWQTLADDFKELKAIGTNVVRVHLQYGKFMDAVDKPNAKSMERLGKLLDLANETGIYLDITGLGSYRKADVPAWYDALDDKERWAAQAKFWETIAARCAGNAAVFCYDLMNEPIVPSGKRKPGDWLSGKPLGGYDFVQYIGLDQGGRERSDIAVQWIKTLSAAIRKHDKETLITVGQLPTMPKWGHFSGFVPEKVAPELDYISVHIYPKAGEPEEALDCLKKFAVGKPVVIEETFPLSCTPKELKEFLLASRPLATGWIGHYDGYPPQHYEKLEQDKKITFEQAVWFAWLKLFQELKPDMIGK